MVCFCLVDLKGDWIYQCELCSLLSDTAVAEYGSKTLLCNFFPSFVAAGFGDFSSSFTKTSS